MREIIDCFGRKLRLTDERLAHILGHPEMGPLAAEIERTLREPQQVRRSRSDPEVRLYYRHYAKTPVGGKWLCIVVKYAAEDAFVITAYVTDALKAGEPLWAKK